MLQFLLYPPIGSFTIADPQNWVALSAFVVTAVIVSHLSASVRKQALESTHRQHEMEQLYTLSRNLLLLEVHGPLAQEITNLIAQVFELPGLAFYDRTSDRIHRAGPHDIPVDAGKLRDAALQGTVFHDSATKTTIIPISLGGQPIGSLGIQGSQVSETALHAIGNLTAITLERAHAQDVATRAEAARQSEELKSTMLDALAHEFKTPLTPIKAAVTSMLSDGGVSPTHQELLRIVDEETDRLNSMLTEAIQMSRIEAGQLQLHRSPQSLSKIFQAQLEKLGESIGGTQSDRGGSRRPAPRQCGPGIHRDRDLAVVKQCLEVHTAGQPPYPPRQRGRDRSYRERRGLRAGDFRTGTTESVRKVLPRQGSAGENTGYGHGPYDCQGDCARPPRPDLGGERTRERGEILLLAPPRSQGVLL